MKPKQTDKHHTPYTLNRSYAWFTQLPLPAPFNHQPIYTVEGQEDAEGERSASSTPPPDPKLTE